MVKPEVDGFFVEPTVVSPAAKTLKAVEPIAKDALGETVVTIGVYKGKKLNQVSPSEWNKYCREIDEKLKDPQFPGAMRNDARKLLSMIAEYLLVAK